MHTLFLLNPTAGKTDCTQQLPQQINAAAARAGLAPEEYTIRITTHAGHARELARAAAAGAQQAGEPLRIFTAGGDGTFNEALTGAYGFAGGVSGPGCPAGGRGGAHRSDADQPRLVGHHLCCRAGRAGGLRHPQIPAHPAVRRGGVLSAVHCGAAVRAHRPPGGVHHRR